MCEDRPRRRRGRHRAGEAGPGYKARAAPSTGSPGSGGKTVTVTTVGSDCLSKRVRPRCEPKAVTDETTDRLPPPSGGSRLPHRAPR
jgi:hypothetical protein